jgi:hypothetical protein
VFFFAYRFNKYINNKKKASEKASLVMRISAEEVIKANEAIEESMENPSEEKE